MWVKVNHCETYMKRDIYEISGEATSHVVIDKVKFEKSNDDIQTLLERVHLRHQRVVIYTMMF